MGTGFQKELCHIQDVVTSRCGCGTHDRADGRGFKLPPSGQVLVLREGVLTH